MITQDLIDKIQQIRDQVSSVAFDRDFKNKMPDLASELERPLLICDDALIDWKIEQRKAYTLEDAKRDVRVLELNYYEGYDEDDNAKDYQGEVVNILDQLHKGVKNE